MAYVNHSGTYSSNGVKTTIAANTEIKFANGVNSLVFSNEGAANITIKINGEANTHLVKVGYTVEFDDLRIGKITIVENGAVYSYSALWF